MTKIPFTVAISVRLTPERVCDGFEERAAMSVSPLPDGMPAVCLCTHRRGKHMHIAVCPDESTDERAEELFNSAIVQPNRFAEHILTEVYDKTAEQERVMFEVTSEPEVH